jgi:hypothetical protein
MPPILVERRKYLAMAVRKLADSVAEHRKKSGFTAGVAVITLSMSRSMDTDKSGDVIQELLENNGIEAVLRGDMDPIGNVTGTGPALLVEEAALPQAKEIYEAFFSGGDGESAELPAEDDADETNSR